MIEAEELPIRGALRLRPKVFQDTRGSFREIYRAEAVPGARSMVQANLSRSQPGVIRGLHWHRQQTDYWFFMGGQAFVGLYDLRRGSPTHGTALGLAFDAEELDVCGLYIPPGIAHGFCAVTEVMMEYLVDAYFTGEDEHGLAWDDPDVAIEWPVSDPILSDRDRVNPSLGEVLLDPPAM